ncbi:MAG: hypothetical protein Q7R67_00660 [bacterium]|nr:hypothetical protein [bacterium]
MKTILKIILLVGALGLLYYVYHIAAPTQSDNTNVDKTNFTLDPSNATFTIEGEPVILSEDVALLPNKTTGDLNNDEKPDQALLLAQSGGGSGVFVYIASYVSGPINYKGTNALFLGDRIAPQSITIANGVVTVTYLDRGKDEALAAEPTIKVTKKFVYKNGELVER